MDDTARRQALVEAAAIAQREGAYRVCEKIMDLVGATPVDRTQIQYSAKNSTGLAAGVRAQMGYASEKQFADKLAKNKEVMSMAGDIVGKAQSTGSSNQVSGTLSGCNMVVNRVQEVLRSFLSAMMADVDRFQRDVLGLPYRVGALPEHRAKFRADHLYEELNEFRDAWRDNHVDAQVDALVDLVYVALGALLEMGVNPLEAHTLVHEANMRKRRGETKRGEVYDAAKPDGWTPPDHGPMLARLALNEAVSPAFLEATRVKLERGARYNQGSIKRADHFIGGNVGHLQINWIKMIRIRSEIEGGTATNEALSEHLRDLLNYLAFWYEELNGGIRP